MLPTLDEFLAQKWPKNSYLDHDRFVSLYVRKGDVPVVIEGVMWRCTRVLTVANVEAISPGEGAFTDLVADLVRRDLAVHVECVHNERFADKLLRMGFIPVNQHTGPHFLFNHDGHLLEWKI